MVDPPEQLEQRLLVLAPTGRDATLTCELLRKGGLRAHACRNVAEVCRSIEEGGAAGLMMAEEVLVPSAIRQLQDVLARQGSWSDLPILIFTSASASARVRPSSELLLTALGNVTLLDRPLRPISMMSAARAALRARKRQYAARAELHEQQRAVRGRDEFLAMLGHELRNPLSAITMALELDRDGAASKYRDIVRRQAGHLARLVDDLLDVSRVTSGKITLRREPLDLAALTRRCVAAQSLAAESHQLSLRCEAPHAPVLVQGDPVRLEQVIVNLINNATKYTKPGGHIVVAVSSSSDQAMLEVRDDGVGLAPEMLGRVFELFTQVEGTLDRAKGGMGIGLTLVRSLIELHGGSVEAQSDGLGRGSTFRVHLPLAATRAHQTASERPLPDSRAGGGYHVLVIEDNDDSRELLALLLGRRGHQVTTAADGLSGVREALAIRPDVLLVDIGLPGLDGYAVAEQVRAALGSAVTLIAVTGYGQPDDQRRALAAGFDVHLTKPLDMNRIDALLQRPEQTAS